MLVRFLGKLWVNPINIPLQRFASATHRGPPSKGEFSVSPRYPIYFVTQAEVCGYKLNNKGCSRKL